MQRRSNADGVARWAAKLALLVVAVVAWVTTDPSVRAQPSRPPNIRTIDGVDLRAPLTGTGPSPRQVLFYYWDSELRAVRKGAYKAHFITSGAYGEGDPRLEHNPPLLFNVAEDPGERHNIAAGYPNIVADLVKETEAHRRTVAPAKPLFDELLPTPTRQ